MGANSGMLARAWRGEIRAWKPFWLLLLPAWLVALLLTTWVGILAVALIALVLPPALLVALGALLLVALLAGAVFLWRSAFNVGWRPMGHLGRACAVAMLAAFGYALYDLGTDKAGLLLGIGGMAKTKEVPKERRLLVASQSGDLEQVRKLLDAGHSPGARETEPPHVGRTPLHHAAGGGHYYPNGRHLEVAELLLARGADVNAQAEGGYTPLHVAAGLGQARMVELLLAEGADIDAKDRRGTPLHAAVLQGHEAVVALLLERKAGVGGALAVMGDVGRYKPEHTEILRRLLDAGADPDEAGVGRTFSVLEAVATRSEEGALLLVSRGASLGSAQRGLPPRAFRLAEFGRVKALQLAFDKGFDPTTRGTGGRTLMHAASTPEVVDLLLSRGLRVDVTDDAGDQKLHLAMQGGNRALVAHLLAKGAPVNARNAAGRTPLMLARGYESVRRPDDGTALIDLLLEKGADLRLRDKAGYAALDVAAESRDPMGARRLIERGAAATARDANGYTALHRARSVHTARVLLEAGASAKAAALDGRTPLHLLAAEDVELVELLLKSGADVTATDKDGRTPLFTAVRNPQALQALIDAGASVETADREGKTPMHYAAVSNSQSLKLLLDRGAALNARDNAGDTPLHDAARRSSPHWIKALLDLGADPDARNREGKTPAQLAEEAARAQARRTFARPGEGSPSR